MPIIVDWTEGPSIFSVVSEVARRHRLTVFDAHDLELAARLEAPLASLDKDLVRAARQASIGLIGRQPS